VSTWVALEPLSSTVEAGGEAVVWLRVRNTGDVVEEYHVDVVGEAALWCAIEPATIRLFPGTTGSVRLTFAPPRSPDATAGPHPFGVRVRPVEAPDAVAVPEGNLSVIPFVDIHAELLPVTVRGWHRAKPRLVVDNHGNTPVTAAVIAAAQGNRVDFDIRTPSFQIPPGRAHFSVLKLRPERLLWLGRKVSHPFTTTVQPSGSEPATVSGTYIQSALLPTWMSRLGMLLAGLLAAFVALWLLAKPSVASDATALVTTAPTVSVPTPSLSSSPAPKAVHAHAPIAQAPPRQTSHPSTTVSLPQPVGYWKLNQTSGTTAADSAGDHPATGANVSWCSSKDCADFNENSDFVTDGPVLNTGPGASFSVAAWVWMYYAPSTCVTFVSQDGTTNSGFYLQFCSDSNASWAFSRVASDTENAAAYRAVSNAPAGVQKWTYLVGVFNGATNQMQLYVNGALQDDTVTDPTPYAAEGDFAIGRGQYDAGTASSFIGAMGNVEAFNVALNAAQIKQLLAST
jgi:hypothetical protein